MVVQEEKEGSMIWSLVLRLQRVTNRCFTTGMIISGDVYVCSGRSFDAVVCVSCVYLCCSVSILHRHGDSHANEQSFNGVDSLVVHECRVSVLCLVKMSLKQMTSF